MSTPRFGRFSVFFPMWNEEAYIERTVAAATEVAEEPDEVALALLVVLVRAAAGPGAASSGLAGISCSCPISR